MSLADEIEKVKNATADKKKRCEEGKNEAGRLYTDALETFFAEQYEKKSSQDEFIIEKNQSLEIINTLDEMRIIANLVYTHNTRKATKQIKVPTLFGSKSTIKTEFVRTSIPARIEISRSDSYGILNGAGIVISNDNDSSRKISLTDFHDWTSYNLLKSELINSTHSTASKDFQYYFDEWLKKIKDLERPIDYGFNVSLFWNFKPGSRDTDCPTDDSFENLTISVSKSNVTISCSNESRFAAISLSNCTPQWIDKKLQKYI